LRVDSNHLLFFFYLLQVQKLAWPLLSSFIIQQFNPDFKWRYGKTTEMISFQDRISKWKKKNHVMISLSDFFL
jgi:hypothetical protein